MFRRATNLLRNRSVTRHATLLLAVCGKERCVTSPRTAAKEIVGSLHACHIPANSKMIALFKKKERLESALRLATHADWAIFKSIFGVSFLPWNMMLLLLYDAIATGCLICFGIFWNGDQSYLHFLDAVWGRLTLAAMISYYFCI